MYSVREKEAPDKRLALLERDTCAPRMENFLLGGHHTNSGIKQVAEIPFLGHVPLDQVTNPQEYLI